MAQAINELYEGAKFFVGPVVARGFLLAILVSMRQLERRI